VRAARKAPPTPVDLANYVGPAAAAAAAAAATNPAAGQNAFYRNTPMPRAASGGGGRFDLDVPTFIRKQGTGTGD
jgi:hypothetical protein